MFWLILLLASFASLSGICYWLAELGSIRRRQAGILDLGERKSSIIEGMDKLPRQIRTCDFCGRGICSCCATKRPEGLYCMSCWEEKLKGSGLMESTSASAMGRLIH